jgi:hypothetical protein
MKGIGVFKNDPTKRASRYPASRRRLNSFPIITQSRILRSSQPDRHGGTKNQSKRTAFADTRGTYQDQIRWITAKQRCAQPTPVTSASHHANQFGRKRVCRSVH